LIDNLDVLSLERKTIYNIISDIFILNPDREFCSKLSNLELWNFLGEYLEDKDISEKCMKYITFALEDEREMSRLNQIFEMSFVIPVANYFIPPFASAYISYKEFRSNNEFYSLPEELNTIYANYGIDFSSIHRSDHISIICAFMSILIASESKNKDSTLLYEKNFFNRFILSWAFVFFKEISTKLEESFYKHFALLCKRFFEKEQVLFSSLS
jgi:TorA maturation chaperone TorD